MYMVSPLVFSTFSFPFGFSYLFFFTLRFSRTKGLIKPIFLMPIGSIFDFFLDRDIRAGTVLVKDLVDYD